MERWCTLGTVMGAPVRHSVWRVDEERKGREGKRREEGWEWWRGCEERGEKEKQRGGGVFFYVRSAKGERKDEGKGRRTQRWREVRGRCQARSTDHNQTAVSERGQLFSRSASPSHFLGILSEWWITVLLTSSWGRRFVFPPVRQKRLLKMMALLLQKTKFRFRHEWIHVRFLFAVLRHAK